MATQQGIESSDGFPSKLLIEAATRGVDAVIRFHYNRGSSAVVIAACPEAEGTYLTEKSILLRQRGLEWYWGDLDLGARRRLVEAALEWLDAQERRAS